MLGQLAVVDRKRKFGLDPDRFSICAMLLGQHAQDIPVLAHDLLGQRHLGLE
jgi:hypothetical protein